MKEMTYEDGYGTGMTIAENSIEIWQDEEGPPIPWPKEASEINAFVEITIPAMNQAFKMHAMKDAREAGINPQYLPIPREYLRGIEDGYRERLPALVFKAMRRIEWAKTKLVQIVSPEDSPVRGFAPDTPYVLIKAGCSPIENGFAKGDGTFTDTLMDLGNNVIMFPSAQSAIAWAEAAPRRWKVVNKAMF